MGAAIVKPLYVCYIVYGPKRIPHAWHDVGATPGKMLVVAQPAGHLEAFAEYLEKLTADKNADPAAHKALFEKHDMEIVGPPCPKKLPSDLGGIFNVDPYAKRCAAFKMGKQLGG